MATAITPKSVMRENFNLQHGYGEVPGFMQEDTIHYALPCGSITTDIAQAKSVAKQLDQLIRRAMPSPKALLH